MYYIINLCAETGCCAHVTCNTHVPVENSEEFVRKCAHAKNHASMTIKFGVHSTVYHTLFSVRAWYKRCEQHIQEGGRQIQINKYSRPFQYHVNIIMRTLYLQKHIYLFISMYLVCMITTKPQFIYHILTICIWLIIFEWYPAHPSDLHDMYSQTCLTRYNLSIPHIHMILC